MSYNPVMENNTPDPEPVLCDCGNVLEDPEDATYCQECQIEGDIYSYELKKDNYEQI